MRSSDNFLLILSIFYYFPFVKQEFRKHTISDQRFIYWATIHFVKDSNDKRVQKTAIAGDSRTLPKTHKWSVYIWEKYNTIKTILKCEWKMVLNRKFDSLVAMLSRVLLSDKNPLRIFRIFLVLEIIILYPRVFQNSEGLKNLRLE